MVSLDMLDMGERKIHDAIMQVIWERPAVRFVLYCTECDSWEPASNSRDVILCLVRHCLCGGDLELNIVG